MKRLLILATVLLSACGFQLRGAYSFPFDTLYIALAESSELRSVIKRNVEASTQTRIVAAPADAQASLTILGDVVLKKIMSLNSAGRVREYQLERTFTFRVTDPKGQEFLPPNTIRITREMTFDDAAVLSKEAEEVLLWRDIQNDLVQQLLRRLAAGKLKPAGT
ncbi:MAG TPA: LPS assembly lipoprotein LptE [Rhodocyclaceae bacterium]|nr:LPS assembly lipoprotein LptE [Rhodocyclaceae bacterium]